MFIRENKAALTGRFSFFQSLPELLIFTALGRGNQNQSDYIYTVYLFWNTFDFIYFP